MNTKIERKLLHYTGKAISIYNMIEKNDRVLVCLSGGKDSFTLAKILNILRLRAKNKFTLHILIVDQGLPGWNGNEITAWLKENHYDFTLLKTNIFNVVKIKERPKDSYCVLCSRLRRGHIYTFAKQHGYNKVALGHHRDDLVTSLLMSIFFNGSISSMPPKLITKDKKLIVIRPFVYCQETDISQYASEQKFPISSKGLCGAKENHARKQIGHLIHTLTAINYKISANILHALSNVRPSQLMDLNLWDFKKLEKSLQ